jgi:hypothetical protein
MRIRFICEKHEVDLTAEETAEPLVRPEVLSDGWTFDLSELYCPMLQIQVDALPETFSTQTRLDWINGNNCADSWIIVGIK